MGCGSSKVAAVEWVPDPSVPGQGLRASRDFELLELSNHDVCRFYGLFRSIDVDHSHHIDLPEFYAFFKQEPTAFGDRVFAIMDDDKSGHIDFREFVLAMWNYLSFSLASLVKFSFSLYDVDESGFLDISEVRALVQDVYGSGLKTNHRVQRILDVVDVNLDGRISFGEFQKFNRRYPMILFPAFTMQQDLRRRVFGEPYWRKVSRRRGQMGGSAASQILQVLKRMDTKKFGAQMDKMLASESKGKWTHAAAGFASVSDEEDDRAPPGAVNRAATFHHHQTQQQPPTRSSGGDGNMKRAFTMAGADASAMYGGDRGGGQREFRGRFAFASSSSDDDDAYDGFSSDSEYGTVYGGKPRHMAVDSTSPLQGFDMSKFDINGRVDGAPKGKKSKNVKRKKRRR